MGQKINPLGFRLGITQKYQSYWFITKKEYAQLLIEDFFLRKKINTIFQEAGITHIEIQRKLNQIKIEIKTARPTIIIGKDGKNLDILKNNLEKFLKNYRKKNFYFYKKTFPIGFEKPQLTIYIVKISDPDKEANFIGEFIVEQLQKRIPFRRAMKQAILRVQKEGVKGIKIQVSGRLNGAEIARSEWIREGRVPLQTLKAKIDYSYKTAKTIYGIIGIKIWIFKKEN